jgi:O-acetyl-ADP-ribose deacetylase
MPPSQARSRWANSSDTVASAASTLDHDGWNHMQRSSTEQECKVIGSDGLEYSPIGLSTIKQWYVEQRLATKGFSLRRQQVGQLRELFDVETWEHVEIIQPFLDGRVLILVGDITKQCVDAIVNAANSTLRGGGGVDGALHEAGSPEVLAACEELRRTRYPQGLPTGEAVITTGGRLPARYLIHTVGPIKGVHGAGDAELLASCYRRSLTLAVQHGLRSVAFPAISTGVYGYPRDEAAVVASQAIADFLARDTSVQEVRLVFFTQRDAAVFLQSQVFPTTS